MADSCGAVVAACPPAAPPVLARTLAQAGSGDLPPLEATPGAGGGGGGAIPACAYCGAAAGAAAPQPDAPSARAMARHPQDRRFMAPPCTPRTLPCAAWQRGRYTK